MKCPLCNLEMRVKRSRKITEDDKEYREVDLSCMNRDCPNFEKVVETTKQLISTE